MTAKERLDEANVKLADLQEQQERSQQLYASAVQAADGDTMARSRITHITLEEQLAALNLQAQRCLIKPLVLGEITAAIIS